MAATTRRTRKDAKMLRFDTPEFDRPAGPVDRSNPGSITRAIKEINEHKNQQAASLIFRRYFDKLVRRFKGQVHRKLQSISDSDDLAAYALSEVLRYLEEGRYPDLRNREGLWALMVAVAEGRRKQEFRHECAEKRNFKRVASQAAETSGAAPAYEVHSTTRELPPDFWAEFADQLEVIVSRLKPNECKVLALELQGYDTKEMAVRLSSSGLTIGERQIRRLREEVQETLRIAFNVPGKLTP